MATKKVAPARVGEGGTMCIGSDCYPFTVVSVLDSRTIGVSLDEYRWDESAKQWIFTTVEGPASRLLTLRGDGTFRPRGTPTRHACHVYTLGEKHFYQDPSF
jgi:hypothetical protein